MLEVVGIRIQLDTREWINKYKSRKAYKHMNQSSMIIGKKKKKIIVFQYISLLIGCWLVVLKAHTQIDIDFIIFEPRTSKQWLFIIEQHINVWLNMSDDRQTYYIYMTAISTINLHIKLTIAC